MHNNYFFLRKLSSELNDKLKGGVLVECFSQSPNELILGFSLPNREEFWVKMDMSASFSCISFPSVFYKSKKGVSNYFKELIGLKVIGVDQFDNERAFKVSFGKKSHLVFKLFGNRSNVSLYEGQVGVKSFSKQFYPELEKALSSWNRELKIDQEEYLKTDSLTKFLPTLGKDLLGWLQEQNLEYRELIKEINSFGENGFYIDRIEGKPKLSLFDAGGEWYRSAIDVVTAFYDDYIRIESFERAKKGLLQQNNSRLSQQNKRIKKIRKRLEELKGEQPLNQVADVVMANLHAIPEGCLEIELFDFYTNENLKLKFKRNQKPQSYAEQLYRKSKNRSKEVAVLEDNVDFLKKDTLKLEEVLESIRSSSHFKELKPFLKEEKKHVKKEQRPVFKEYQLKGFQILVGRNSKNNDELTKSAHKEDLWLHAKDVSGSHVVIKTQSGKDVPKVVIEYAASLAAAYSKRKTDSLCPVMVTAKKYVRKIKGAPAGAVVVEREEVILIEPLKE